MISAIDSVNSPILRYTAVVMYSTGLPVMLIAGLVKAWKLALKDSFICFYVSLKLQAVSGFSSLKRDQLLRLPSACFLLEVLHI
jgi:hypothetical protein